MHQNCNVIPDRPSPDSHPDANLRYSAGLPVGGAKKVWQVIFAVLLSLGIISCSVIINAPSWWLKSINSQNIAIAELVNLSANPLVLTPANSSVHLMSISHNLDKNVRVRFVDSPELVEKEKDFSDRFLLNYPQQWLDEIKQENKFSIEKIYQGKVVTDPNSNLNFSLIKVLKTY